MFDPRTITRYDVLRVGWRIAGLLVLVMASATGSYVAMAAVVSLQPPDNNVLLRIPVLLEGEGEEAMAGVQFDLQFDPAHYTLEGVEAGAITSEAGKETILSEPTPGTGRVLITGFNNHALADGHVATLILRRRAPDAAEESLAIGNFLASDPFGNQVPLGYRDDYSYPPTPPEPIEASLTETAEEASSSPVADVEENSEEAAPVGTARVDGNEVTAADAAAVASGPVGGADFADTALAQTPATSHPQVPGLPVQHGGAARGGYTAPHGTPGTPTTLGQRPTPGSVFARPSRTSAQTPTRPSTANRPAKTANEQSGTHPPTNQAAENDPPRLALALPTSHGELSRTPRSGHVVAPEPPASPRPPRDTTQMLLGVGLFVLFFLGFSVVHIRIVRFLSHRTRRTTS